MYIITSMENKDKDLSFFEKYRKRFVSQWFSCGPGSWDTLLVSNTEINRCKNILNNNNDNNVKDLNWARHVKECTLHPDTNEAIPFPFRMSAHVPMNTILLVGMLGAATRNQHLFWQTANQTFNAFQFYANRNKSNHVSTNTLAIATIAAVGGATGSVLIMDKWLKKVKARGKSALVLSILMPLFCAGAAKPFQISLMRQDELFKGIKVYDKDNEVCFGQSIVAGKMAVALTIFTRITYLIQPMIFPPLLQHYLKKKSAGDNNTMKKTMKVGNARNTVALNVINILFIGLCSAVATPMCIAMFDQQSSIPLNYLEKEVEETGRRFYDKIDRKRKIESPSTRREKEETIEYLGYFNKGL